MTPASEHPRRRLATIAAAAAVVLAALAGLVVLGRWEGQRHADSQNAAMAATVRAAGPLISRRLDAYRLATTYDCLLYAAPYHGSGPDAFELCFDANGRLVETIDRRVDPPRIASLLEQPARSTTVIPVRRLLAAFVAVHAFRDPRLKGMSPNRSTLPVGFADTGALTR